MSSHGNNGNNLDLMLNSRRELAPTDITADAWVSIRKLIDSVSDVTVTNQLTHIPVKDLITVYKWLPQLCNMATFLPIFTDIIKKDKVKIEDVPKFDSLMYKVMEG